MNLNMTDPSLQVVAVYVRMEMMYRKQDDNL